MEVPVAHADDVLKEAADIIAGSRQDDYGSPENCFGCIADFWSRYLDRNISPCDVAMMMVLLKVAREQNNHKRDNLVDICGYAALAEQLTK